VTPAAFDHDEQNYIFGSTAPRGNATTVTRKCSPGCSDAVTKYGYDVTGQVVSVTDPKGRVAGYSYTDTYSSDDGSPQANTNTNTYLTTLTKPTTNGISHISTYQYGFNDGKLRTATDENSNVTRYCYYTGGCSGTQFDSWFRTTEVSYPDGGQTNMSYQDGAPSPSTTVSTLLDTSGDTEVSTTVLDGMGHITQTQLTSDPSGPDTVSFTYDGLGRVSTKTNPSRSTSELTYGVTTYQYDALSRPVSVQNPDKSFQYWCYDNVASGGQKNCRPHAANITGDWVDFADENSNDWQRTTDSFGRLTNVAEPNGAMTYYSYDTLGNLICAAQDGGAGGTFSSCAAAPTAWRPRSFAYDSLSHLIQSLNPETGWTCYGTSGGAVPNGSNCTSGYDANGNLAFKTDARNIVTSYSYDALNRLLSKRFSNDPGSTPSSCYQYDSSSLGVGQLAVSGLRVPARAPALQLPPRPDCGAEDQFFPMMQWAASLASSSAHRQTALVTRPTIRFTHSTWQEICTPQQTG